MLNRAKRSVPPIVRIAGAMRTHSNRRSRALISPDEFLQLLNTSGKSGRQICRETGMSTRTIQIWKAKYTEFKQRYEAILKDGAAYKAGVSATRSEAQRLTGWEDRFIDAYVGTCLLAKAARIAGISVSTIRRRVDPRSPSFDEKFAQRFADAEDLIGQKLEDEAHRRVLEGGSDGLLKFLLAARKPEVYGKRVEHTHEHRAGLNGPQRKLLHSEMVEMSRQMFGSTERKVIDVASVVKVTEPQSERD